MNQDAAVLHDRTRAFMAFYERQAYLVFNLALRIAVDDAAARAAAERAFVQLAGRADAELQIARVTTEAALAAARAAPVPGEAGDADATRLLAAMAALQPRQRAALALVDLCDLGSAGVATVLGLGGEGATDLLGAARDALAAELGTSVPDADAARADWLWTPPPAELWERVYPALHRIAQGDARPAPATRADGRAPASAHTAGTLTRLLRRGPVLLAVLGAAGVGAMWGTGTGLGDVGDRFGIGADATPGPAGSSWARGPQAPAEERPALAPVTAASDAGEDASEPARQVPPRRAKPLAPAELDELRKRELRDLARLQRRQSDASLPVRERAQAAADVRALQRTARRRLAIAERRERALRAELRRERARRARAEARERARARARAEREPDEEAKAPDAAAPPQPAEKPATSEEQPPAEEEGGCLFNPDDGTYVCPEG